MWASPRNVYWIHAISTQKWFLSLSPMPSCHHYSAIFKKNSESLYYIIKNACCSSEMKCSPLCQNCAKYVYIYRTTANVSAHISVKVSRVEDLMRKKDKFRNHIHRSSYACEIHFSNDEPNHIRLFQSIIWYDTPAQNSRKWFWFVWFVWFGPCACDTRYQSAWYGIRYIVCMTVWLSLI